jgi:hypothetical protein
MQAVVSWLPWLLGLALRVGRGEQLLAPLGVAVACVLTAGHPQMAVIALLGSLVVFLAARGPGRWRAAFGLGLGLVAAAPQLFASGELSRMSARAGGVDSGFANVGSLPPWELTTLALPRFWGFERPADIAATYMHKGTAYFGTGESHWEGCLFVGVVVLVLMTAGRSRLWWGLLVGSLILALGKYTPAWWVLQQLPVFDHFRFPVRFAALAVLAASLLAAEGYDRGPSRRGVAGVGALVLLMLLGGGVVLGVVSTADIGPPERLAAIAQGMRWNLSWGLLAPAIALVGCVVLPRRMLPALLVLELSLSLWQYNPRSLPPSAPEGLPDGLARIAVVDRVAVSGAATANLSSMFGAREVLVPSPLLLPYHEEVLADAGVDIGREHGPVKAEQVASSQDALRRLCVTRVYSPHPMDLPEVATGVYALADAPCSWLEGGEARISSHESGFVRIEAAGEGTVVLADTWYPGWVARVDGVERDIERVHGSLRGVPIAGQASIELSYEPWWRWTLVPSLMAWILLLVGAVYTGRVRLLTSPSVQGRDER